jgi:hypothetical protein
MNYPYYNVNICETVLDAWEESLLQRILKMEYDGLDQVRHDINTSAALNPNYRATRECVIKCKGVIYRANELRKVGRLQPATSLLGGIGSFMAGWLLADEFWKRQGG